MAEPEPDHAIVERCAARTAIAGNPSDGFSGAVLSVPVTALQAEVAVRPSATFILADGETSMTFPTWEAVRSAAANVVADDDHSLVLATIAATAGDTEIPSTSITIRTTIPQSVGLAGSSAIVIATLRAIARRLGLTAVPTDELASIALHVERDLLDIPAGLQDRVVQAYNEPTMMRFGPGDTRRVGMFEAGTYQRVKAATPFRLLVAYRSAAGQPSQIVHRTLRERFDDGDSKVVAAMSSLAAEAERAAEAYAGGRTTALGVAMDRSFDLRQSIVELDPAHVEMIDTARHVGAHANYSGSGGAIVVLAGDESCLLAAADALSAIGCEIVTI